MMAAARCTVCGTNFPINRVGTTCPACDCSKLEAIQNDEPHDNWQERVRENAATVASEVLAEDDRSPARRAFEAAYGPADVEAYELHLAVSTPGEWK